MNAFERRAIRRKLAQTVVRNNRVLNRLAYEDSLMRKYEEAFKAVYGWNPTIRKKNGWYTIYISQKDNLFSLREADLINETRRLQATLHERELENANCL